VWAELQRLPAGFLQQIIEYRSYAAAVAANDVDPAGWQASTLRTVAKDIEHALVDEEMANRDG
jgi:hypothetical protein